MFAKRRIQMNVLMGFAMAAAVVLLGGASTHAQTVNDATNTLKVSPVRSDITVKAGTNKKVRTIVTNLTNSPITVRPILNDFIAGDERGTPALILDANKFAPTHSLKRFMRPVADVTIPANKSVPVDVLIVVPQDAQAGGYFGALRFAPTTPDDGAQVNLSPSVASLILMTVPGPMVEKLNITDFDIQQDGKTGATFENSDNLQVSFRFASESNVQTGPSGKISVKSGDKVVYEADFNAQDPRDMILPDSARRWEIPLKDIGGFGQYTVVGTFTYGSKNQTVEVTKTFWVIPMIVIIAAVVALIVLIGLIVGIWLFLRSYKRRILRGHSGHRSYRR